MLSYWSNPYPDEILYSLMARYIGYLGNSGPKQLLPDLFGRATVSSTIDLPSGLGNLAKGTRDHKLSVKTLISQHTLFPYYSKFMSEERKAEIIGSMLHKSGDIHTRCGINAGQFSSIKIPRYCPVCSKEDMSTYKETFFRRAHQIPSIRICTKHNIYLCELEHNAESINKHFFVKPQSIIDTTQHFSRTNRNNSILNIGKKIVALLTTKSVANFNNTPLFYNESIKQLGFQKGEKSLAINEIYEAFTSFYDSEMLDHYVSQVDVTSQSCWLKAIFRKHRKSFDPVRHILVLNFLDHIRSKKNSKHHTENQKKKFVCRNPVCDKFNSNRDTNHHIQIDPKSKREITYVKCGCDYSYTSSYLEHEKKYFVRVKSYGKLWQAELKKLMKSDRSIRSIANELHVDSKTVKNNLNKIKKNRSESDVMIRKKEWADLKKSFPRHSKTELRVIKPAVYSFLYRKSRDWLINQNYPTTRRSVTTRVDWKKRDAQLVVLMKKANAQLKTDHPKRRRSPTALLNLIGKESMFRRNKKNLPRLTSFIKENAECLQKFRLRRLAMAANDLRKRKEPISYWKLLRSANIRKEYVTDSIHSITLKIIDGSIENMAEMNKSA